MNALEKLIEADSEAWLEFCKQRQICESQLTPLRNNWLELHEKRKRAELKAEIQKEMAAE